MSRRTQSVSPTRPVDPVLVLWDRATHFLQVAVPAILGIRSANTNFIGAILKAVGVALRNLINGEARATGPLRPNANAAMAMNPTGQVRPT